MTNEGLIAEYEERAREERKDGGEIEINRSLPYIAVVLSNGSEYFFQGEEADAMIDEADSALDGGINAEDFILATAQSW